MAIIGLAFVQKAASDPDRLRAVLDAAHRDPMGPVIELSQPIEQRRYTFIDLAKRDTASFGFATRNYAQMQPRLRRPKPKYYALDKSALTPELIRSGLLVNQETKSLNQKAMAYEVAQRTEGLGANNQRTQKVVCTQVPTTIRGEFVIISMDDLPARLWYELFEPELDNSLVRNGLIECSIGKQLPYYAIYE
jgi:hypothetical protein